MTTKVQETVMIEARQTLRAMVCPGDTVNLVLRHVSRSGMSRNIAAYIGDRDVTWLVAKALGWPVRNSGRTGEGVYVTGCGMDMGFHLVYTLSRYLFPPSQAGADTGYNLKHRWL